MRRFFDRRRVWLSLGVCALLLGLGWWGVGSLRRPQTNAVMRGWQAAQQRGCFSCHGPAGQGGIPNPGSEEEEIPAWDGGMLLMYVEKEDEIREWILYGAARRLWKGGLKPAEARESEEGHEVDEGDEDHEGLVHMPAFESLVSDGELSDLVAYVKTVGAYNSAPMPSEARAGLQTAQKLGCFGCHRQKGLIGVSNPGSFKGYIPPWRGADFRDLVRSEEELEKWILEGGIDRLDSNPLARFFTNRQVIQMPAYRSHVSDQELAGITAYIGWLSSASEE